MPDLDMICNVNTPASSHLACRACGYSFAEGEPVSVRFVPLNGSMIESGAYHDRCVGVVPVGAYDGSRSPAPASGAPDEEAWRSAALRWQKRAEELERLLEEARVTSNSFATRLAASERLSKLASTEAKRACDEVIAVRAENASLADENRRLSDALAAAERAGVALRDAMDAASQWILTSQRPLHPGTQQAYSILRAALTPTAPSPEQCPSRSPGAGAYRCMLWTGHDGEHRNGETMWGEPVRPRTVPSHTPGMPFHHPPDENSPSRIERQSAPSPEERADG